jgi:hypothetical protein
MTATYIQPQQLSHEARRLVDAFLQREPPEGQDHFSYAMKALVVGLDYYNLRGDKEQALVWITLLGDLARAGYSAASLTPEKVTAMVSYIRHRIRKMEGQEQFPEDLVWETCDTEPPIIEDRLNRTVTVGRLIELARFLKCEEEKPTDVPCSEYDLALVELVVDAAGLSMNKHKQLMAQAIGVYGICK